MILAVVIILKVTKINKTKPISPKIVTNMAPKDKAKVVKVINTGKLTRAVKLTGIGATAGAKAAIEGAGGSLA